MGRPTRKGIKEEERHLEMYFLTSLGFLVDRIGGEKSIILPSSRFLCMLYIYEDGWCKGKILLENSQKREICLLIILVGENNFLLPGGQSQEKIKSEYQLPVFYCLESCSPILKNGVEILSLP